MEKINLSILFVFVVLMAGFAIFPMNNQGTVQNERSCSPNSWCDQAPPTYAEIRIQTNDKVRLEVNISNQSGDVLYNEMHHLSPTDTLNFDRLIEKYNNITININVEDGGSIQLDVSVEQGVIFNVLNTGKIDPTPVTNSERN